MIENEGSGRSAVLRRRAYEWVSSRELVELRLWLASHRSAEYAAALAADGWQRHAQEHSAPNRRLIRSGDHRSGLAEGTTEVVVTRWQVKTPAGQLREELTDLFHRHGLVMPTGIRHEKVRAPARLPDLTTSPANPRVTWFGDVGSLPDSEKLPRQGGRSVSSAPRREAAPSGPILLVALVAGAAVIFLCFAAGLPVGTRWRQWGSGDATRLAVYCVVLAPAVVRDIVRSVREVNDPGGSRGGENPQPQLRTTPRSSVGYWLYLVGMVALGLLMADIVILPGLRDVPPLDWSSLLGALVAVLYVAALALLHRLRRRGWRWRAARTIVGFAFVGVVGRVVLQGYEGAYLSGLGVPVAVASGNLFQILSAGWRELLTLIVVIVFGVALSGVAWWWGKVAVQGLAGSMFAGCMALVSLFPVLQMYGQQIGDQIDRGRALRAGDVVAGAWGDLPRRVCAIRSSVTPPELSSATSRTWFFIGQSNGQVLFLVPQASFPDLQAVTVASTRVDWRWVTPGEAPGGSCIEIGMPHQS